MQIKEREHLIKKIENGELIPEEAVRKKLEKVLEIRLIDAPVPGSRKEGAGQTRTYSWGPYHYQESEEIAVPVTLPTKKDIFLIRSTPGTFEIRSEHE